MTRSLLASSLTANYKITPRGDSHDEKAWDILTQAFDFLNGKVNWVDADSLLDQPEEPLDQVRRRARDERWMRGGLLVEQSGEHLVGLCELAGGDEQPCMDQHGPRCGPLVV